MAAAVAAAAVAAAAAAVQSSSSLLSSSSSSLLVLLVCIVLPFFVTSSLFCNPPPAHLQCSSEWLVVVSVPPISTNNLDKSERRLSNMLYLFITIVFLLLARGFSPRNDRPHGGRRTMITAIATTMATDRPPNCPSPLHSEDVAVAFSSPPCFGHFRPLSLHHCCCPTLCHHHSHRARRSHRPCCQNSRGASTSIV